jgi:hypothetical protein
MFRYRSFCLLGCVVWLSAALWAANPNGYYDAINGKKGEALKPPSPTCCSIILSTTTTACGPFSKTTDVRTTAASGHVFDVVRTSSWGMNREHSFPKSWWGGDVNAAYTDINHLVPLGC